MHRGSITCERDCSNTRIFSAVFRRIFQEVTMTVCEETNSLLCRHGRAQRTVTRRALEFVHEGDVGEVAGRRHGPLACHKLLGGLEINSKNIKKSNHQQIFQQPVTPEIYRLTLATSVRETLSMLLQISSAELWDPLARAWAPMSSSKPSEVSIDMRNWLFSWVLHRRHRQAPHKLQYHRITSRLFLWIH